MQVKWTVKAVSDLQSLRAFVARDKPGVAKKLVREIITKVEKELVLQPHLGRPGRTPGTREFVITGTPYILPYRVQGECLEIIRVLHGAMRWPEKSEI